MARCASMTCSCFTLVRIESHAGRLLLLSAGLLHTLTNVALHRVSTMEEVVGCDGRMADGTSGHRGEHDWQSDLFLWRLLVGQQ